MPGLMPTVSVSRTTGVSLRVQQMPSSDYLSIDVNGFIGLMRRLFNANHVFFRELIQNAIEAINQATRLGENSGKVLIESDVEQGTVSISDDGIGMTNNELLDKLTVLFRSGWPTDAVKTLGIGQFGFGFYSVFLAADEVTVVSRSRRAPQFAYRLSLSSALQNPILEELNGTLPNFGTMVTVRLRGDCRHLADDDFIRSELVQTFLYMPYSVIVNGRALGSPTRDGWTRRAADRTVLQNAAKYIQNRYSWDNPPLLVYPLIGSLRGWLAIAPENESAPPVEVYRRGIRVTRAELIPEPLNIALCGIIDCDDINVKPDRETLVQDPLYRTICDLLAASSAEALKYTANDNPVLFQEVLRVHRKPITIAMLKNKVLRESIGASYTLPRHMLPSSFETSRDVPLSDLFDREKSVLWLADSIKERSIADRACHMGHIPLVIEHEPEQDLVRTICEDHGVDLQHVSQAFVEEMRTRMFDAPRAEKLFRRVLPSDCDLICCKDSDERLPVRVIQTAPKGLEFPSINDNSDILLRMLLRKLVGDGARKVVVVVNCGNPLIASLESGSGPFKPGETALARILFFIGRIASGISVSVEETSKVYHDLQSSLEGYASDKFHE